MKPERLIEIIMDEAYQYGQWLLFEGVYDPGILKAVFLAGGPASGKTAAASEILGIPDQEKEKATWASNGLKLVSSDTALEALLNKAGYGTDLGKIKKENPELFKKLSDPSNPDSFKSKARVTTAKKLDLFTKGRLGVVIDKTGDNPSKIKKLKDKMELMGYDTHMIFVNTSLDVAQIRNQARPRKLEPELVSQIWDNAQKAMGTYRSMFGANKFREVRNDENWNKEISKGGSKGKYFFTKKKMKVTTKLPTEAYKVVGKWIKAPIKNKVGREWVQIALRARNMLHPIGKVKK